MQFYIGNALYTNKTVLVLISGLSLYEPEVSSTGETQSNENYEGI